MFHGAALRSIKHGRDSCIAEEIHSRFIFPGLRSYSLYSARDSLAGSPSTTQGILLGTSAMMAIPSVMVFLSLVLRPSLNRWLNIILGLVYTAIMLVTMPGEWTYYIFFGVIEVILTILIVWFAWKWPRLNAA
jgi:hypothetical protein